MTERFIVHGTVTESTPHAPIEMVGGVSEHPTKPSPYMARLIERATEALEAFADCRDGDRSNMAIEYLNTNYGTCIPAQTAVFRTPEELAQLMVQHA